MPARRFSMVLGCIICAAFLLGLAPLLKHQQAQARPAKQSLTHQTTSAKALPDLKVERVWTGPDCKVRVRLRNAGRAGLSPKIWRFKALKVYHGSHTVGTYTFRQVDPDQKLTKAGGVVVFIVPMEVSAKMSVKAVADPDKKIAEADETMASNSASAILLPCRVAKYNLPIRVSKVVVKQGTLRLVLIRVRGDRMDARILETLRIKVRGVGGSGAWSVRQVDRSGSLLKLGKVEFNTKLRLKKGTMAHTRLIWKGGSRMASFKVPADLSRTLATGGMRVTRPSRRDTMAPGPAAVASRIRPPSGMNKVAPINRGIKVVAPKEGQDLLIGRPLRVEYRFTRAQAASRVRLLLLKVSDQAQIAETIIGYQPPGKKGQSRQDSLRGPNEVYLWRLPTNANLKPGEEYVLLVQTETNHGYSGSFKFLVIGDRGREQCHGCVFITSPKRGEVWPRGTRQRISWTTTPRDGRAPSGWRIFMLKPGIQRGNMASDPITPSRIQYDSANHEYYFEWRVPEDYPTGSSFQVEVEANNNPWANRELRAVGGSFTIPGNSLAFLRDFAEAGHTYYHTNVARVQWRIDGSQDTRVRITLRRGNEHQGVIAPYVRAGDSRMRWAVGGTIDPPPVGDGYYLRIETVEGPYMRADSAVFTIAVPTITIMLPRDGLTYRHGETLLVRWAAPYLQGNVKIYLKGGGYTSSLPLLGTAAATSGMFMWRIGRLHPDARGEALVEGNDMKVVIIADNNGPIAESPGHFSIVVPASR